MLEYFIGFTWMGIVVWAIVLIAISKRLSWLEKTVILIAIILSFTLAILPGYDYSKNIYIPAPLNILTMVY